MMRSLCTLALTAVIACGGVMDGTGTDVQESNGADQKTYGVTLPSTNELQGPAAKSGGDRVKPHEGIYFANMQVHAIYIGGESDRAPSRDNFMMSWFASSSWGRLGEYGIGPANLTGSTVIPTDVAFREEMYEPEDTISIVGRHQLIKMTAIDGRLHELVHGRPAGDAGPGEAPLVPKADAYVIFLPDAINVSFGRRGTGVQRTCVDAGAYHAWDGDEAYSIMPPCEVGRGTYALSHELAEMATDPQLGLGWASDDDGSKSAGEIADLCRGLGPATWLSYPIARFWSNKARVCIPQ